MAIPVLFALIDLGSATSLNAVLSLVDSRFLLLDLDRQHSSIRKANHNTFGDWMGTIQAGQI